MILPLPPARLATVPRAGLPVKGARRQIARRIRRMHEFAGPFLSHMPNTAGLPRAAAPTAGPELSTAPTAKKPGITAQVPYTNGARSLRFVGDGPRTSRHWEANLHKPWANSHRATFFPFPFSLLLYSLFPLPSLCCHRDSIFYSF